MLISIHIHAYVGEWECKLKFKFSELWSANSYNKNAFNQQRFQCQKLTSWLKTQNTNFKFYGNVNVEKNFNILNILLFAIYTLFKKKKKAWSMGLHPVGHIIWGVQNN